jgi:uncharacterized protein (TIGR00369 family)
VKFSDETMAGFASSSLYRTLGIRMHAVADGSATSSLDPEAAVCWPTPGQPHGGVIFTVMDTTMAFAALSNGEAGTGSATVDCSIQYTAPAREAPFRCEARTVSRTARTAFVRAELTDAQGTVVALAQGTFRLFAPRPAPALTPKSAGPGS